MYLLIDNYDSFTYNLYQSFAELGADIFVVRNDEISLSDIKALNPEKIIISPGPKTPREAGISNNVIEHFSAKVPLLGICLGHQCITEVFGGRVVRVDQIVHGKTSMIRHNKKGIFRNVPDPFPGARYHSLETIDIPECLEVTARTEDNIIMGIEHRTLPVIGLQFHPESFLTNNGRQFIKNFIEI